MGIKEDIIYGGLNVKFVKSFIAHKHIKENGKVTSFTHVRKFKDAILWASKIAKDPLPPSFYDGIETYLVSYKNLTRDAAKGGN